MSWKNRKEALQLSIVVSAIAFIIGLILAVGLFGMICAKTIKALPVAKSVSQSETPVLDKVRADVEKRMK